MSVLSYAAAQGYIRARLSRLLDAGTWAQLLETDSLMQLDEVLAGTSAASAIGPNGSLRVQNLRGESAAAGRSVARFLPRQSRALVVWYTERLTVENLKTVLRAVHYRLDRSRVLSSLIPIRPAHWRWEELLEAESVESVIERIRDSPFARPLEHAMERYRQEGRLFYPEVALDLFYFQQLVRLIEAQSGADKDDARQFLGHWIAVQNLLWAYRYKVYGAMTAEEIINYTLHRAFAAGLDALRRVVLGSPLRVEVERLGFHLGADVPEAQGLTEIEFQCERQRFERATMAMDRPISRLGGVLGYLWLFEGEIHDLTVIVEGKTTGLSAMEIARRLLRAA